MESSAVQKVCKVIYNRYPKFSGQKPKVSEQASGKFLLIFSQKEELSSGKTFQQTIRVVADETGSITKISSSRG